MSEFAPLKLTSVEYMTVPTTAPGRTRSKTYVTCGGDDVGELCDTIAADATMTPSDARWNVTGEPFGIVSPSPSTVKPEAGETTRLALLG